MSIVIHNFAIHYLQYQSADNQLSVEFTPEQTNFSSRHEQFIAGLHQAYNSKGSKGFGYFSETDNELSFEQKLQDYLQENQGFYAFSQFTCNSLVAELDKYELAETGYLLLCHYEHMGGRYLLVALIPVTEHYLVDQARNINSDSYLDIAKLQLAARIDLFEYQNNSDSNRYISFIKGRAGRKVADFFLEFLNCQAGVDAKAQTQSLVNAVEEFVAVQQLDAEEKQQSRKELASYCKEQQALGDTVKLQDVAEILPKSETSDFYQFCQQHHQEIEAEFPHEQTVVNKATKYSGYGNGISLSFERRHLGQDVVYNPATETITIHKIPPNLKEQLSKLLATEDS